MRRPILCLTLLALTWGYAVFQGGGVLPQHWNLCLLALGAVALLFWIGRPAGESSAPLGPVVRWLALLLPAYVAFQLLPLPASVLGILSPERAGLLAGLGPVLADPTHAAISVLPSATLPHLLRFCAYAVLFLLVAELTRQHSRRPWVLVAPIVAIAGLEAALGVLQSALAGPQAGARGTYVNRNHFAGLLEMALPFAATYPFVVMSRVRSHQRSSVTPAFPAGIVLSLAALILIGILVSLSRMGFLVSVCSLALMAMFAFWRLAPPGWGLSRFKRGIAAGLVACLAMAALVILPPDRLVDRFAALSSSEEITADGRLALWAESWDLLKDYPLFGVGLGAYEAAFLKYKKSAPMKSDDYAHNDYLQLLAELGAVGFLLAASLVTALLARAIRVSSRRPAPDHRYLGLACAGSMTALLLHSTVDFNLYIPANGLLFAWVLGVAAGLRLPARAISPSPQRVLKMVEVEPQVVLRPGAAKGTVG